MIRHRCHHACSAAVACYGACCTVVSCLSHQIAPQLCQAEECCAGPVCMAAAQEPACQQPAHSSALTCRCVVLVAHSQAEGMLLKLQLVTDLKAATAGLRSCEHLVCVHKRRDQVAALFAWARPRPSEHGCCTDCIAWNR